jgi:hypothetical protein
VVARDGVEPPTPAFSVKINRENLAAEVKLGAENGCQGARWARIRASKK